jgi:Outer membrane lipoprotein-sorting protein
MSRSLLLLALIAVAPVARASEVQQALKRADEYRLAPGAMRVLTRVESFKSSKLDKERQYLVFLDAGRRSLVLSRSPIEKGQKLLMLGDDFWIILPSSQRAIRITPAQKLLGDASIGDIATMSWAEDYDGVEAGEAEVNGVPCRRLDVKAQRRGVTYQRIELYVAKLDGRPVQADLYLASEKLAKRATFLVEEVEGRPQVTLMTLADQIETGRETRIRYLERAHRSVPDEFYNPMFLTRNEPGE